MAWITLLLPSFIWGVLSGVILRKQWGVYVAGAGPFLGLLTALIYTVYLAPDADNGDGFWIIALLFGGAIAAFTGVFTYQNIQNILKRDIKEGS